MQELVVSFDGREHVVGAEASIGRAPDCDIEVDHPLVSRHHGALVPRDGHWVLEDRGSRNGVYVGSDRVERVTIDGPVEVCLGEAYTGPRLTIRPATVPRAAPTPVPEVVAGGAVPGRERIGRAGDNDRVLDDMLVSRYHAELRADSRGRTEVVDLGSHNGTFVNGHRVERAVLNERDLVGIGRFEFRFVDGRLEELRESEAVGFEALGVTVRLPGGRVLVDDVSLALGERSMLAVVGPSGCGKSTLVGALTGLRPATSGTVLYGGRDLYANYDELHQRIGFVPQDDVVHRELTVERALQYASALRFPPDVGVAERTRRVDEVIDELGLGERRGLPIGRLSGGQRKRVSVGYELLTKPSLLFLDEPTSGLDPGYERALMQGLRDLADAGQTVVVVTHSVASLHLCDRVLFLATGGRVAYFGPPQRVTAYFGCDDLQEAFQVLAAEPDRDWAGEFQAHPDHQTYVAGPMARAGTGAEVPPVPVARPARLPWFRQFRTLTRRYLAIIASDRRFVAQLVLQAPVLGFLMYWRLPDGELGLPDGDKLRLLSSASIVLFNLVIASTWLGMSNAAREIVKELPQFRRERTAGLSSSAYIASKTVVLGAITVAQVAVIVFVGTIMQRGPRDAVALGWAKGELMFDLALVGLAAMALGLLISAASQTTDQAMTVLPVVVILQMVLASGSIYPEIKQKIGIKQAAELSSAQWGYALAASTADINQLQAFNDRIRAVKEVDPKRPEQIVKSIASEVRGPTRWAHRASPWLANVLMLVALTVAALIGAMLLLSRHEFGPAP